MELSAQERPVTKLKVLPDGRTVRVRVRPKVVVVPDHQPVVAAPVTPEPNYRCMLPRSAQVRSGCEDFWLNYGAKDTVYQCPSCGRTSIMPLF